MNTEHAKEVSAHLRKSGVFSRIEAADVIDNLIVENEMLWKERPEPLKQAELYMSECRRLESERDALIIDRKAMIASLDAENKFSKEANDAYRKLSSEVNTHKTDAERYRWLRRAAVQLSLSNDTIAGLVKDKFELDGAMTDGLTS